jgi:hypothetical protein
MKVCSAFLELIHMDRKTDSQTDMANPLAAFLEHSVVKEPKIENAKTFLS